MIYYQWVSGPNYGATDMLINTEFIDGEKYAIFDSGAKVKISELNSKLKRVQGEDEILLDSSNLENEFYSTKNNIFSDDVINNIMYGGSKKTVNQSQVQQSVNLKGDGTVFAMIKKQIESNPHKLDIVLKLPTLKKEFYDVLSKMHTDVKNDILEIIVDTYISKEELKKQIEENLDLFYNDVIYSNSIEVDVEKF